MTTSQLISALSIAIDASTIVTNEGHNSSEVVASNGINFVNALLVQGKLIRVLITGLHDAEEIAAKVHAAIYPLDGVQYSTVWLRESAPSEEGWFTQFEVGI